MIERRSAPSKHQGFTLIEILIVLVIMSISIGFAVIQLGNVAERRAAQNYAEHIQHWIAFVREQAVLNHSDLRIIVTSQTLSLQDPNHVLSSSQSTPLHLPKNLLLSPQGKIDESSTGTLSAFKFFLGSRALPHQIQLIGHSYGQIQIHSKASP